MFAFTFVALKKKKRRKKEEREKARREEEKEILKSRHLKQYTIILRFGHVKFEMPTRYPFEHVKNFENMIC